MSRKTPKIDRHNVNQWSKSLRPNLNGGGGVVVVPSGQSRVPLKNVVNTVTNENESEERLKQLKERSEEFRSKFKSERNKYKAEHDINGSPMVQIFAKNNSKEEVGDENITIEPVSKDLENALANSPFSKSNVPNLDFNAIASEIRISPEKDVKEIKDIVFSPEKESFEVINSPEKEVLAAPIARKKWESNSVAVSEADSLRQNFQRLKQINPITPISFFENSRLSLSFHNPTSGAAVQSMISAEATLNPVSQRLDSHDARISSLDQWRQQQSEYVKNLADQNISLQNAVKTASLQLNAKIDNVSAKMQEHMLSESEKINNQRALDNVDVMEQIALKSDLCKNFTTDSVLSLESKMREVIISNRTDILSIVEENHNQLQVECESAISDIQSRTEGIFNTQGVVVDQISNRVTKLEHDMKVKLPEISALDFNMQQKMNGLEREKIAMMENINSMKEHQMAIFNVAQETASAINAVQTGMLQQGSAIDSQMEAGQINGLVTSISTINSNFLLLQSDLGSLSVKFNDQKGNKSFFDDANSTSFDNTDISELKAKLEAQQIVLDSLSKLVNSFHERANEVANLVQSESVARTRSIDTLQGEVSKTFTILKSDMSSFRSEFLDMQHKHTALLENAQCRITITDETLSKSLDSQLSLVSRIDAVEIKTEKLSDAVVNFSSEFMDHCNELETVKSSIGLVQKNTCQNALSIKDFESRLISLEGISSKFANNVSPSQPMEVVLKDLEKQVNKNASQTSGFLKLHEQSTSLSAQLSQQVYSYSVKQSEIMDEIDLLKREVLQSKSSDFTGNNILTRLERVEERLKIFNETTNAKSVDLCKIEQQLTEFKVSNEADVNCKIQKVVDEYIQPLLSIVNLLQSKQKITDNELQSQSFRTEQEVSSIMKILRTEMESLLADHYSNLKSPLALQEWIAQEMACQSQVWMQRLETKVSKVLDTCQNIVATTSTDSVKLLFPKVSSGFLPYPETMKVKNEVLLESKKREVKFSCDVDKPATHTANVSSPSATSTSAVSSSNLARKTSDRRVTNSVVGEHSSLTNQNVVLDGLKEMGNVKNIASKVDAYTDFTPVKLQQKIDSSSSPFPYFDQFEKELKDQILYQQHKMEKLTQEMELMAAREISLTSKLSEQEVAMAKWKGEQESVFQERERKMKESYSLYEEKMLEKTSQNRSLLLKIALEQKKLAQSIEDAVKDSDS